MDFQHLCELADKELTLGMADERLLERAYAEAKGVDSHARQIYWYLRATALQKEAQASGDDAHIHELKMLVEHQDRRSRARKERHRWFWGLVCFAAVLGTVIFPRLAIAAYASRGFAFYGFAFLGVACLALTVIAYTASRYHTHSE